MYNGMTMRQLDGIASRTPINLGEIVNKTMRSVMSDYEPMSLEHSPMYLLFGFKRQLGRDNFSYIILEGDRRSGKITAEVAVSIVNKIPYYRLGDMPLLGTFGFRGRVCEILNGTDMSHQYYSRDMLEQVVHELVSVYCNQALRVMNDRVDLAVKRSKSIWEPLYKEWQDAERAVNDDKELEKRYGTVDNEIEVRNFILKKIKEEQVLRFLGKLRSNYLDKDFLNCQVYLMAHGLEFLSENDTLESLVNIKLAKEPKPNSNRITWSDIMGPSDAGSEFGGMGAAGFDTKKQKGMAEAFDDVTQYLTGRIPQTACVDLGQDEQERHWNYCFYKTFAVLEGLYTSQSFKGMFEF